MSYFVSAAGRAYCGPRFQVGVSTQSTPTTDPLVAQCRATPANPK
jgi:hypothetical protein